jgi:hypothetical protein
MKLFSLRSARSQTRAQWLGLGAVVAGVVIGVLGLGWLGAALCAVGTGAVVLAELARTEATLLQAARQQEALVQLQPLLGDFPVWLGGWAADPLMMRRAVELVTERRPRLVVECGSSSSTCTGWRK